jgi:signal transduction histidine kinase
MLKRHLTDMSIRTKLIIGFVVILTALVVVGWQGIAGMRDIKKSLSSMKTYQFMPFQSASQCNIALVKWYRGLLSHVLSETNEDMDTYEQIIHIQGSQVKKIIIELTEHNVLTKLGSELIQQMSSHFHQAELIGHRILVLSKNGQKEESRYTLKEELRPVVNRLDEIIDEFMILQKKQLNRVINISDERYKQGFIVILTLTMLAFFISLITALYLSKIILANIDELIRGSEIVANGDLKKGKVQILSKDEFGYLGLIFNNMLDELDRNIKDRNKQRETFISVLIHDLKGSLTPILGFTKRLIEGKDNSEEDKIETLNMIYESAQNIFQIINNTSRALKKKITIQSSFDPKEVVFNDFLLSVVENFLPEIDNEKKEISINNKNRDEWRYLEDIIITVDSHQLKILIENLLSNALKYAENKIEIEFSKTNGSMIFVIADDGPGIPKEYQDKIFEEFFQAPGSKEGTGIGLYSVKQIIENHNGKINIGSSENKGTSFEINFPIQPIDESE